MERLNRRDFLKKSFAAGATLALASSYSRILGANDEIRIAVVGFHSKGMQHIQQFHEMPGVRVVALCDVDQNILDRAASRFKENNEPIKTCKDVRKILDDKEIDAVAIATPNHWHSLMGIWACQAGKDVYLEKPISHDIWEGRKLVEAARKYNRIVQAGTQNRSDVGMRAAKEYIDAGNLGKILFAHGVWFKNRGPIGKVDGEQKIPEGVDYDLWTGPAAMKPLMRKELHYDWHWIWEYGNGDLGNLGAHQIDDCRFLIEGLPKYPKRVMSLGGRFVWDDDGQTPNVQMAVYDFEETPIIIEVRNLPRQKGLRGVMDAVRGTRMGNVIQCEQGYLVVGRGGGWAYDNDKNRIKQFPGDGGGEHQKNFIDAMRSRKPDDLHAEIEEGHYSAALCHVANISYRHGQGKDINEVKEIYPGLDEVQETLETVKTHLSKNEITDPVTYGPWLEIDAKKENFKGKFSKEANNMLKRTEYRKPFVVPEKV